MKRFILKQQQIITLLCVIVLGYNLVYGQDACSKNEEVKLPGTEPPIELKAYIKPASAVQGQQDLFKERFKCEVNDLESEIMLASEHIKMSAVLQLYKESKAAADAYTESHPGTSAVTALRISFGMKGNQVVFFYQPIFIHGTVSNGEFGGTRTEVGNASFYAYDASSQTFKPASPGTLLYDYHNQIRIKHSKNKKFERINCVDSWKGDSKSIIFSFQEIFKLYTGVFDRETDDNRYCQEIVINNGAARYRRWRKDPFQTWRAKHTLYITCAGQALAVTRRAADGDGANLAHLCPPSCNSINYDLKTQQ
jgi:hypothetical protein